MSFIHANGQTGRVSAIVGAGDLSLNLGQPWGGASGTAKIVLDMPVPGTPNPLFEITYGTVTNGSPTVTALQRGQEGTSAQQHQGGTAWVNTLTALDIDSIVVTQTTFNVKSYGAKGDGVTDDTAAVNAAMAAAALAANSNPTTGAIVFFPAGIYMIGSPLLTYNNTTFAFSNVTLMGQGKDATIVRASASNNNGLLRTHGSQGGAIQPFATATQITYLQNFTTQDMTFDGSPTGSILTASNGTMVSYTWVDHLTFRRVKFTNSAARLFSTSIQYNVWNENTWLIFEQCDFTNFVNNSHIEAVMVSDTTGFRFLECTWCNVQYSAISLYQLNRDGVFLNCKFWLGTPANTRGAACTGIQTGSPGGIRGLLVFGCDFRELWNGAAVFLASGGSDNFGVVGLQNVRIIGNTVTDCDSLAVLGEVDGFVVAYNWVERSQTAPVKLHISGKPCRYGTVEDNWFINCGQTAAATPQQQTCVLIQQNAIATQDAQITIQRNHAIDNQAVKTCTSLVYNNVSSGVAHGYLVENNDVAGVAAVMAPAGWQTTAGTDFIVRNNRPLNPAGVVTVTVPTSATPLQNNSNFDQTVYFAGAGTLTGLRAAALPTPLMTPAVSDVTGGGSGWSTSTPYTVAFAFTDSAGSTQMGPASSSVTPANATDQLLVAPLPIPTTALTLVLAGSNTIMPPGTYTIGYTFFNELGEGPMVTSTANISNPSGTKIVASGVAGANLAIPQGFGIIGVNLYVTAFTPAGGYTGPAPSGRVGTVFATSGGTQSIPPYTVNQLPFGIPAPANAPVLMSTDMSTPGAPTVANAPPVTYQAATLPNNSFGPITLPSVAGIYVGMSVTGQDGSISKNTHVASISGSTITLDSKTGGARTNYNLVFNGQLASGSYGVQLTTVDASGETPASPIASATVPAGATSSASTTFTSTTATDSGASWTTNQWVGYTVTDGNRTGTVLSNTATALTLIAAWSGGTPANGSVFTIVAQGTISVAASGLSANATSANVYFNNPTPTASQGLMTTLPVAAGAIPANQAVTAVSGVNKGPSGNVAGLYKIAASYITMSGETILGPTSSAVNLAPNQALSVAQFTLSDLDIASGQLVVLAVRYYITSSVVNSTTPTNTTYGASTVADNGSPGWNVNQWAGLTVTAGGSTGVVLSNTSNTITLAAPWTGGTPANNTAFSIQQQTGLMWEAPVALPASNGGNAFVAPLTFNLQTLLSTALPSLHDNSAAPLNTVGGNQSRTDAWLLPRECGAIITGVQAWVNPGNQTTATPVGGQLNPFLIPSPGSTTAGPTMNTTGAITVASALPASLRLRQGDVCVPVYTGVVTAKALQE